MKPSSNPEQTVVPPRYFLSFIGEPAIGNKGARPKSRSPVRGRWKSRSNVKDMRNAKRPAHLLNKRGPSANNAYELHPLEPQDQLGRDSRDADPTIAETSTGGSDVILGLQDVPARKNKSQLTSTEYALQEIRSRVRAIDKQWEEVNVRATNTLDNIEEDDLDRLDPHRNRRGSDVVVSKRRDAADRKFSLRGRSSGSAGVDPSRERVGLLEGSRAAAWFSDIGDSGRAVNRDERVAVALAQSHENLAAAAMKFEDSQERSNRLLGGLRGWMDGFTGTARPEDTNPIAAMLPDPGLENEVVAIMTDCHDAALMLEQSTKSHTQQLKDIFSQAGKLYGSELERVQKKGSALTSAAREKVAALQEHANKVETLLNSMQEERNTLQFRFSGAETKFRSLEERFRADKAQLEAGLSNYRHRVMQLQHVVAGYEEQSRRQEQMDREPRLGDMLGKLKAPAPTADPGQLRQAQADAARLAAENTALTAANKKINQELVVLRLADQGSKRGGARPKRSVQAAPSLPQSAQDAVEEALRQAKEQAGQAERDLLEAKRENESLSDRLQTLLVQLDKEKQRPTIVNPSAADTVEQGLREALRDLRKKSDGELAREIEAHHSAVSELESVLDGEREKGDKAAVAADEEIAQLRSALEHTQGKLQAIQSTNTTNIPAALNASSDSGHPTPPKAGELLTEQRQTVETGTIPHLEPREIVRIDYDGLVQRAISQQSNSLIEIRKKAEGAGVAQRQRERADKVFSEVVECCGKGLSSVEHILEGRPELAEVDVDDDEATNIQEALAVAFERAIASASMLLKEALVGGIKACEAEKQALLEQEAAEDERSKASELAKEKLGLVDELQKQLAEMAAIRTELEAARRLEDIRQELAPRAVPGVGRKKTLPTENAAPINDSATWRRRYEHLAGLLADTTKENSGKTSGPTTPVRVRRSPVPSPRRVLTDGLPEPVFTTTRLKKHPVATSIGENSSTPIAKGLVGSSSAVVVPDTSSQSTEASTPVRHNSLVSPSVVPTADDNRSNSSTSAGTTAANAVGVDACVGIVPAKKLSVDNGVQVEPGGESAINTSDGATQVVAPEGRRMSPNSGTQVVPEGGCRISEGASQVDFGTATSAVGARQEDRVVETPFIEIPAEQNEVLRPVAEDIDRFVPDSLGDTAADTKPQPPNGHNSLPERVDGGSSGEVVQDTGFEELALAGDGEHHSRWSGSPPSIEAAQSATQDDVEEKDLIPRKLSMTSDNIANGSLSEAENDKDPNVAERENGMELADIADEVVVLTPAAGDDDVDKEDHSVVVETERGGRTKDNENINTVAVVHKNDGKNSPKKSVSEKTHSLEDDKTHAEDAEGGGVDTPWGGNNSTTTTDEGSAEYSQYDDIDEDELLDKLLDETAPSQMFEDDHQKLLQKLMRSRDDDQVRSDVLRTPISTATSCVECPTLKQRLANQSADVARARVQQIAAEQELEASERRVHVMTSDVASLKRRLAEHADVLKQARALADKVATGPNTEIPQAKAAQAFKDLADKVESGRRSGTSPKGKSSATSGVNTKRRQGGPLRQRSGRRSLSTTKGGGVRRESIQPAGSNVSLASSPERRRTPRKSISNNNDGGRRRTRISSFPGSDPVTLNRARKASILVTTQRQVVVAGRRGRAVSVPPMNSAESIFGVESTVSMSSGSISEVPPATNAVGGSDPKIDGATPEKIADSPNNEPPKAELSLATINSDSVVAKVSNDEPVTAFDATIESISVPSSPRQQPEELKQTLVDSDKLGVVSVVENDGGKPSTAATISTLPVGDKPTTTTEPDDGVGDRHQQELTVAVKTPSPKLTSQQVLVSDSREEPLLQSWSQENLNETTEVGTGAVGASIAAENAAADAAAGPPLTETPIDFLELDVAGKRPSTRTTSWAEDVLCEEEEEGEEESEKKTIEEELTVDQPKSTVAASDFVPTDKSLVAYCEAAARCKLAMEGLEGSLENSTEVSIQGSGVLSQTDNQLQELTERYSDLTAAMVEWGVEAAAALLVEVTKTSAKHRTISAWTAATRHGDRRGGSSSSSEARRDRAILLMAQKIVLREVIDSQGGWETSLFLDSGAANLYVDVSAWPIEDQPAILSAVNDHLREELEESGQRHSEALADLLRRLQASQREIEQLRAAHKGDMGRSIVEDVVVDQSLSVPLPEFAEDNKIKKLDSEETEVVAEISKDEKGQAEKEGRELGEAVVPPVPVSAVVPPEVTHDSDANITAEATAAMDEAKKQLELQLTMALASLRKAREDLQKEKERSRQSQQQVVPQSQCSLAPSPQVQPPQAPLPSQPQQQPFVIQEYRATPRRDNKGLDLIAQADAADRRAKEAEEARLRTGYPLAALAAERRAVADLRGALTTSVCAVLELCQPKITSTGNRASDAYGGSGSEKAAGVDGLSFNFSDGDSPRGGPHVGIVRGPPSTLVQMVCSGDEANVRCATAGYRLSKGVASRSNRATTTAGKTNEHSNEPVGRRQRPSSHRTPPTVAMSATASAVVSESESSKFQEAAANVAHAGSLARNILRGLLDTTSTSHSSTGETSDEHTDDFETQCEPPISPVVQPPRLPANTEDALSAARVAAAGVRSFSTDICTIAVDDPPGDGGAEVGGARTVAWASGAGTGGVGVVGSDHGREDTLAVAADGGNAVPEVDTTATARVVKALQEDALWAGSLPAFVRDTLEAQAERLGQQVALKEREIEILAEAQRELRRELKALKVDYTSADTDDIIRALRKSLRGRNGQVRYLERQVSLAEQSSEVEGGAIEVLEGLLRQRDIDKELYQSLRLKSLEIGLKIRLLQTDAGGRTVEVSRMDTNKQRALDHLKVRLVKQKGIFDVRKRTVAAELERSLPHGMRAFERVSRAIQRLCNGYTSLPGLLQWGRTNAARLEASGGRGGVDDGASVLDRDCDAYHNSTNDSSGGCKRGHPYVLQGATAAPESDGHREPWTKRQFADGWAPVGSPTSSVGDGEGSASWSSVAPSYSTSSTSFPNRAPLPTSQTPAAAPETAPCYLPKMAQAGQVRKTDARRRLKTAGRAGGRGGGGGGRLCAARYDQSVVGSAGGGKELAELDNVSQTSSVSSLLREEMAFRRRNNGGSQQGQRDDEQGQVQGGHPGPFVPGSHQGVPALVPLNNVGMPVRFRQQPRRNQGLHAHR